MEGVMKEVVKASWRTFIFSLAALAVIWDLTRREMLGPEEFLWGLAGILALYTTKQVIEFKKKKQNGGTQ